MKTCENFHRLDKVSKADKRYNRSLRKKCQKNRKRLRPLNVGDKVFVQSSSIKIKDTHANAFNKTTTDLKPAFNKTFVFKIRKKIHFADSNGKHQYYY